MADDASDPSHGGALGGITLRDFYAGCALTGLLSNGKIGHEAAASSAYRYADEMLRKRDEIEHAQMPELTSLNEALE